MSSRASFAYDLARLFAVLNAALLCRVELAKGVPRASSSSLSRRTRAYGATCAAIASVSPSVHSVIERSVRFAQKRKHDMMLATCLSVRRPLHNAW